MLILMVKQPLLQTKRKHLRKEKNKVKIIWTNRTGFIRLRTGFIRRRTGFIRPADEASLPADEASLPANEASPFGPYIFTKWALVYFNGPFLLVFSCPKRYNNTIMMSIYCLFFQDRHS